MSLKRLYSYYILKKSNISCSKLGWRPSYNSKNNIDLNESGKSAAKTHSSKDDKYFKENINIVRLITEFANNKGVNVLFFTPPAYHTYTENLDNTKINRVISALKNIESKYDNVAYVNLLSDKSFLAIDFFDADHLNNIGAEKLTNKIENLINNKSTWSNSRMNSDITLKERVSHNSLMR